MDNHHGEELDLWKKEIKKKSDLFVQGIEKFLQDVEFMGPFYSWSKQKQKQVEQDYYINEKKMLSYLVYGLDQVIKDRFIVYFLKIYQTLIFKYISWYQKSIYNCLYYTNDELKTTLDSWFVSTIHCYIEKYKDVRIPFGSFAKNRVFIQFRGELQDLYRKKILYEQWKDKLYDQTHDIQTYEDNSEEYDIIEHKFIILKNYILHHSEFQEEEINSSFLYNYILTFFYLLKKNTDILATNKIHFKPTLAEIKKDIKIFKTKVKETKFCTEYTSSNAHS